MQNKAVYIHEMRACCCAGITNEDIMDAIYSAKSGIKKYKGYLISSEACAIGKISTNNIIDDLLITAVDDVLKKSTLENFHNTLLIVGTSVGGMGWAEKQFIKDKGSFQNIILEKQTMQSISLLLKKKYFFKDAITFSTACTSSANAIVFAKEILEFGIYDNVLVVGADTISYTTINGFDALGVLSSECAMPFDTNRTGMNVAEGIGVLLLSTNASDIELAGVGCSSDAYNITHPHPEGFGAKEAMRNALENASLPIDKVDYINAHGTATRANDESEGKAILELFPHQPFVSSTKSITGHTLGACGALETIISAQVLKLQKIPSTFNLKNKDLKALNTIQENIDTEINVVVSNSFAFGGNNVSIVLKRNTDEI